MLAKFRLEWREFRFWRKFFMQSGISVIVVYVQMNNFLSYYPGASAYEYVVYSLTDRSYFLVVFPLLCIAWTHRRDIEVSRYPILLRYGTRNEFFTIRFLAKASFAIIVLLEHIGMLCIVGGSLPVDPQLVFASTTHLEAIIIRQFLNLSCLVCVVLLMYEIFQGVVGNGTLGAILTTLALLVNVYIDSLMEYKIVLWTLWGNSTYTLHGTERPDYRFYAMYWAFLLLLLFYIAFELNGRKDYVFEENRKTN